MQLEPPQIPLPSCSLVVVVGGLLDGDVGQVHEGVGDVGDVVVVAGVCEAGETYRGANEE